MILDPTVEQRRREDAKKQSENGNLRGDLGLPRFSAFTIEPAAMGPQVPEQLAASASWGQRSVRIVEAVMPGKWCQGKSSALPAGVGDVPLPVRIAHDL